MGAVIRSLIVRVSPCKPGKVAASADVTDFSIGVSQAERPQPLVRSLAGVVLKLSGE
jgi:hypothetical protein